MNACWKIEGRHAADRYLTVRYEYPQPGGKVRRPEPQPGWVWWTLYERRGSAWVEVDSGRP